jgi:hypothetical protein
MKLSLRAFSITAGILWGVAVLLVGLANHAWPPYGLAFLELTASIYPGYVVSEQIASVFIGAGYALVDGLVGGFIFAGLYNLLASCCNTCAKQPPASA